MSTHKLNLNHALQLRLPKLTIVDIDNAIATVPSLDGFNRSKFIRYAIWYALDSIAEVKEQEQVGSIGTTEPFEYDDEDDDAEVA
jgi:hypothetical protein